MTQIKSREQILKEKKTLWVSLQVSTNGKSNKEAILEAMREAQETAVGFTLSIAALKAKVKEKSIQGFAGHIVDVNSILSLEQSIIPQLP